MMIVVMSMMVAMMVVGRSCDVSIMMVVNDCDRNISKDNSRNVNDDGDFSNGVVLAEEMAM